MPSEEGNAIYDPEKPQRAASPLETLQRLENDDPRAIDFRNRLRTWFGGVPFSHIRQHEFRKWLYWSFFNTSPPDPSSSGKFPTVTAGHETARKADAINEAQKLFELRCGTTFEPGQSTNPALKPLCLTLDPIQINSRPFVWYLFVKGLQSIVKWHMSYFWGATFERHGELEYMIRVPPGFSPSKGPLPILFIHGLGLGIAVNYRLFFSRLFHMHPDRPIVVPLQPHISQDFFHPRFLKPMGRKETMDCLSSLLQHLGWDKNGVVCISHSNGTYVHAWILKDHPNLIKRSCFVDPVTFCSWEGDVCYNFIYRAASNKVELILRYFVATELSTANSIQRHFDWAANSLFFEEIPGACDAHSALYILAGEDSILDAQRVRKYLTSHGVGKGLKYYPHAEHGECLMKDGALGEGGKVICDWLKS